MHKHPTERRTLVKHLLSLTLLCLLALALCACGGGSGSPQDGDDGQQAPRDISKITMTQIVDANDLGTLLKNYSDIYFLEGPAAGEDPWYMYYIDADNFYYMDSGVQELYTKDHFYGLFVDDNEGTYFMEGLNATGEPYEMMDEDSGPLWSSELPVMEKVQSVATNSDGTLRVATQVLPAYLENYGNWYEELKEAETIRFVYNLDPDTLAIYSAEGNAVLKSGESLVFCYVTAGYSQGRLERLDELVARSAGANGGETRTVTCVLNPGTDKEAVYSQKIGKGTRVMVFTPEGYTNIYTDPECTQIFEGETDYDADLLVYSVIDQVGDLTADKEN